MDSRRDILVRMHTPMPRGYKFVRRGDRYITRNCRLRAHTEGHVVYIVRERNEILGIRVPQVIYNNVLQDHRRTQGIRANNVISRENRLSNNFRTAILTQFPDIPPRDLEHVLTGTLQRRSGRVGRVESLALVDKARLSVRAHIRHRHTNYDELLQYGVPRDDARDLVYPQIDEISCIWGGTPRRYQSVQVQPPRALHEVIEQVHRQRISSHQNTSEPPPRESFPRRVANAVRSKGPRSIH
ncbi:hypothetical protein F5Y11DRAFT_336775 [Daldinia sp. FL1419]|nr:hypothetical protein F5Y11DRAFT_336775 [Daldinia sp. FL1419]